MDRAPTHNSAGSPELAGAILPRGVVALQGPRTVGDARPIETLEPAAVCFREAYDENVRFVWRSVRRLGVHPSDVEDACQEVFLVVHKTPL